MYSLAFLTARTLFSTSNRSDIAAVAYAQNSYYSVRHFHQVNPLSTVSVTCIASDSHPRGELSSTTRPRIPQLDGLRGIAVLGVILFHYVLSIPLPHRGVVFRLQSCFRLGGYGVDLFFVLSGLLIGGILLDASGSPDYFRTFYLRRFHRIFPLYYCWLALYVVLGLTVFPRLTPSLRAPWPGWRPALIYLVFMQNLLPKQINGISSAWLGPLWSLAVEEQFYLLMPIAVRFLPKRRLAQALLAIALFSPLFRVAASRWTSSHAAEFVATPMRADALAMGVLVALALRDSRWRYRIRVNSNFLYAATLSLFVGILGLAFRASQGRGETFWGFSIMALFFTAVVLIALVRPNGLWSRLCQLRPLRALGGISYCIYVIHLSVLVVCQNVLNWATGKQSIGLAVWGALLAAVITWALARISWRYLESPMLRRGHAYKY